MMLRYLIVVILAIVVWLPSMSIATPLPYQFNLARESGKVPIANANNQEVEGYEHPPHLDKDAYYSEFIDANYAKRSVEDIANSVISMGSLILEEEDSFNIVAFRKFVTSVLQIFDFSRYSAFSTSRKIDAENICKNRTLLVAKTGVNGQGLSVSHLEHYLPRDSRVAIVSDFNISTLQPLVQSLFALCADLDKDSSIIEKLEDFHEAGNSTFNPGYFIACGVENSEISFVIGVPLGNGEKLMRECGILEGESRESGIFGADNPSQPKRIFIQQIEDSNIVLAYDKPNNILLCASSLDMLKKSLEANEEADKRLSADSDFSRCSKGFPMYGPLVYLAPNALESVFVEMFGVKSIEENRHLKKAISSCWYFQRTNLVRNGRLIQSQYPYDIRKNIPIIIFNFIRLNN